MQLKCRKCDREVTDRGLARCEACGAAIATADLWQERNRRSWNAAIHAHNSHKGDQAAFFRGGGDTLFPDEIELLGDVRGKRILHVQCNCGQDSLSLARRGAQVLGVDLSDDAIDFAKALSRDAGIQVGFEQGEILAWFARAAADGRRFDVAFASYGVIGWIGDLEAWMRGVASILEPGGRLVLLEFHPLIWSIGERGYVKESYFLPEPIHEAGGVEDYVGMSGEGLAPMGFAAGVENFVNPEPCVSFQWTVADIVRAAIAAGLVIADLREYPYANGCAIIPQGRELPQDRFATPEGIPDLPLMLGLVATRR
jgi:2-polyprenyl-3-methyl-5-hydroxy-6-metoxy-1,4-benzoquinol methylase